MATPITAFEQSQATDPAWTPLTEEATYIADLVASSPRVRKIEIGVAADNHPMYALAVGYPVAPTDDELRSKSVALFLAMQHGNECSGRDASLQFARDLSVTSSTSQQQYLAKHPVIFIPTMNPSGFPSSRTNSNGENINREWVSYSQPENRAAGVILRDFRPSIIVDLHEMGSRSQQFAFYGASGSEVHPPLKDLCLNLFDTYNATAQGEGYSSGIYHTIAYNGNYLSNHGGYRNAVSMLVESSGITVNSNVTRKQAVAFVKNLMTRTMLWHEENLPEILSATADSAMSAASDGAAQAPISRPGIYSPPLGYTLTPAQQVTMGPALDRMGLIGYETASGDHFYPMTQANKRLLPMSVDSRSNENAVSAARLDSAPALKAAAPVLTDIQVVESAVNQAVSFIPSETGESVTTSRLTPRTDYKWRARHRQVEQLGDWSGWSAFTTESGSASANLSSNAVTADNWSAVCALATSLYNSALASDTAGDAQATLASLDSSATGSVFVDAMAAAGSALSAGAIAGESWSVQAQALANALSQAAASTEVARQTDSALNAAIAERSEASGQFMAALESIAGASDGATVSDAYVAFTVQLTGISSGAIASDTFSIDFGFPVAIQSGAISGAAWLILATLTAELSETVTARDIMNARAEVVASVASGAAASDRFSIVNDDIRHLVMGAIILRSALSYSISIKP